MSLRGADSGRRALVLIVEDEAIVRLEAVDFIRDAGFDVLEASNADEAIRILESRMDVTIVFTDVDMPGSMDGVRLAHAIRGRWPPIRLVVASSYTHLDEDDLPSGSRFLVKPYRHREVVKTLHELAA